MWQNKHWGLNTNLNILKYGHKISDLLLTWGMQNENSEWKQCMQNALQLKNKSSFSIVISLSIASCNKPAWTLPKIVLMSQKAAVNTASAIPKKKSTLFRLMNNVDRGTLSFNFSARTTIFYFITYTSIVFFFLQKLSNQQQNWTRRSGLLFQRNINC